MSEGDESGERPRKKFKKRVTLQWTGKPLSLPGEDQPRSDVLPLRDDPSGELSLPPRDDDPTAKIRAGRPPREEREGFDAWQRQRQAVTPPPFRPPTLPPKPPAFAETDGEGDALSLVDGRSRPPTQSNLVTEMHDRYALGDYTAALNAAELILGGNGEHREARMVSKASRERLGQLYSSRLGPLQRIPLRKVDASRVRWLGLDHRAGFLLSQVDGEHSFEELIDISGMARLEALKTFVELLELGVLTLSEE